MLSLHKVSLHFGGAPILHEVSLELRPGERVCVVGRNGAGKSTLLKIMSGELSPDAGTVWRPAEARVAVLPQEVPTGVTGKVHDVIRAGTDEAHWAEWESDQLADEILRRMGLDGGADFVALSAGMKRRIWLGRCLARHPELLLLDEPTNHLDIESIAGLESFLLDYAGTLLFVTHDRAFLQRVATRILDLDRGRLISWDCDYNTYLVRKEEWLDNEARQQALFDRKLSQEETWIRQGVKARRTRNMGRVRVLQQMRADHQARRQRMGNVRLEIEEANRSGVKVITAEGVTFCFGERPIVRDFSLLIARGDRIGIIGPNGAGKTTLVRLLLGQLPPQEGQIMQGTGLQIAYFDQLRDRLEEEATVQDSIAGGNQFVEINGRKTHVISYLQDFLFPPERARSTVGMLSGGERHRLLLARLFTRPFNFLVMDEPTNDLDLETLELLEELLANFQGTLLLVSHDRAFLDNVVTDLLVLEGDGVVHEFAGGFSDYERYRERETRREQGAEARRQQEKTARMAATVVPDKPRKITNRERRELEQLPLDIERLESQIKRLHDTLSSPEIYREGREAVTRAQEALQEQELLLQKHYARWQELEDVVNQ